eukprot:4321386-Amphidinium_carterae.1
MGQLPKRNRAILPDLACSDILHPQRQLAIKLRLANCRSAPLGSWAHTCGAGSMRAPPRNVLFVEAPAAVHRTRKTRAKNSSLTKHEKPEHGQPQAVCNRVKATLKANHVRKVKTFCPVLDVRGVSSNWAAFP